MMKQNYVIVAVLAVLGWSCHDAAYAGDTPIGFRPAESLQSLTYGQRNVVHGIYDRRDASERPLYDRSSQLMRPILLGQGTEQIEKEVADLRKQISQIDTEAERQVRAALGSEQLKEWDDRIAANALKYSKKGVDWCGTR